MSVPVPRAEEAHDEEEPHRRVSEGDRVDASRLRGGQRESCRQPDSDQVVNASPSTIHHQTKLAGEPISTGELDLPAEPPLVVKSGDKDLDGQMRNLTVNETTPPSISPNNQIGRAHV